MEDTMFDNRYLLKKGATVMTAAPIQHTDASIWGRTVGNFDHRRFLRVPGKRRVNPAVFRSFGGGTTLCPGRHFVSTEVMSFAALMLLRFDVKPAAKDGKWTEPRKDFPMTFVYADTEGRITDRDYPSRQPGMAHELHGV
ncbi:cytochrome P450 [Hypoxylon cercidicola]|nr:cytochrome P450 [Hypoxylon cercidicola]